MRATALFQAKNATAEERTPTYRSGPTVPAVGSNPPWTATPTAKAGASIRAPSTKVVRRKASWPISAGRWRSSALYEEKLSIAANIHRSPGAKCGTRDPLPTSSRTPVQATAIPAMRRHPSRRPPRRSYTAITTGDAAMIMPIWPADVDMPAWLTRVL